MRSAIVTSSRTPGGPCTVERPLARAQVKRLEQARQAEPMVGVEMGDEHLGELGQSHRLHELALGALTAVEQDAVAATAHEHRGQPAPRRGDRAGGADEERREVHGLSLSAKRHKLERQLAGGRTGQAHRAGGGSPALGRAARVEDLKAVGSALVQRDVRVPEDHRVGVGEPGSQPREPARRGPGVVDDRDPCALRA